MALKKSIESFVFPGWGLGLATYISMASCNGKIWRLTRVNARAFLSLVKKSSLSPTYFVFYIIGCDMAAIRLDTSPCFVYIFSMPVCLCDQEEEPHSGSGEEHHGNNSGFVSPHCDNQNMDVLTPYDSQTQDEQDMCLGMYLVQSGVIHLDGCLPKGHWVYTVSQKPCNMTNLCFLTSLGYGALTTIIMDVSLNFAISLVRTCWKDSTYGTLYNTMIRQCGLH